MALRSQLRIIRPKPKEAWPFLGFGYGSLSECGNLYPTVPLTTAGAIKTLARKIARWVADNRHRLVGEPFIPEALDDRAADNWEFLLAAAETAGGEWPARLRAAVLTLSGEREEDSSGVLLLADIRRAFEAEVAEAFSTGELLAWLTKEGEQGGRWKTWRKGRPMNEIGLAKVLKPFGIESRMLGPKDRRFRGYPRTVFEDAWGRYLPSSSPQPVHLDGFPREFRDFQVYGFR